jgi:hypothetical protein
MTGTDISGLFSPYNSLMRFRGPPVRSGRKNWRAVIFPCTENTKLFSMSLPLPSDAPRVLSAVTRDEMVFATDAVVRIFQVEQKKAPVVLIIGIRGPALAQAASNAGAEHVVLCDANPEHTKNILWPGADPDRVTMCTQHSLRLGSSFRVDIVIMDLFSATINRWAPVYIMRDLLKRGILRTFGDRLPYVCPSRAAMTLRVYESPTHLTGSESNATKKMRWTHAGPLTDTDLYTPVSPRIPVLHEQYDRPAQTWPPILDVAVNNHANVKQLVGVLEWTVQLLPTVLMS